MRLMCTAGIGVKRYIVVNVTELNAVKRHSNVVNNRSD